MQVRNAPDAGSLNEAEPDSGDFRILGEANSGVISGGAVTASAPESMVVNVAAAEVLINGAPLSFASQAITIAPSNSGFPRFDLVGWTSAGATFITGTASDNPAFPVFDPTTFVVAASVYVPTSATQLAQDRITEKRLHPVVSLRRRYAADTDTVIDLTSPSQANGFQLAADGKHSWLNSILRRTGTAAMEWVTSLTLKQSATTAVALVLKAASGAGATHKLLDVQGGGGSTSLASINALGELEAANFKHGSGPPNGVVTAGGGALYVDTAQTNGNISLWLKTTPTGNTGWASYRTYTEAESAFPTGTLLPWLGLGTDTIPTGFSIANGGNLAINASTQALFDLIGTRFGTAPAGFMKLPDLRHRVIAGASGIEIEDVGVLDVGDVVGQNSFQMTATQMPVHDHDIEDDGHVHPQEGPPWYYKPGVWGWPAYQPGGTGTPYNPGMWVENQGYNRRAFTGIVVKNAGGTDPVVSMQETMGLNWLVKW
jgi:hypothetical protein